MASPAAAAEKYELLGQPAPDLVARGLTGENVRLSEHRGEVVVVSFWSGSLQHLPRAARGARPHRQDLWQRRPDGDRRQSRRQPARAPRNSRARRTCSFQLLVATAKNTGRDFRVDRLPMIVFVDRAGVLRVAHREFKSRDEAIYVRELRTLLDE